MLIRTRTIACAVLVVAALSMAFAAALWRADPVPPLVWALGSGLAFVVFLVADLRAVRRPLQRSAHVLCALSQGDLHAAPSEHDLALADEAGQIARGIAALRLELLSLQALRHERSRDRAQHEDLMREQMRLLAANLDEASRADVLRALAPDADCGSGGSDLAGMAHILGRMAGLVSTQQDRLVGLLRELRHALEHQAVLAGLQQELAIARNMQLSILPRQAPCAREVEVAALMVPAKEVGGDFYDYFMLDAHHLAMVVADVSGKGIPAAFFMAISRTLFKSNALILREPAQVVNRLNDQLCAENDQMMFVTAFFAVLDLRSGELEFVNAGHNPPVIRGRRAEVSLLPRNQNTALAVLHDQRYLQGRIQMQAGDTLLLYTDGVTEANDPSGRMFGEQRLLNTVMAHGGVGDLPQALLQQVRAFEDGTAQADDITCVAVRYMSSSLDAVCA